MLGINGEREQGEDVRSQNVTAAMAVANVVKTSFGPVGLDKMLVNDVGDVLVTNDGATILQQLDIKHAAAKVLVELATLQDREVGDGTTSVVILASELLRRGNILVQRKLHPTCVISGYRLAAQEAARYVQDVLAQRSGAAMTRETLMAVARTSLSSKVVGHDADPDFFAGLAVDSLMRVMTKPDAATGAVKASVKAVNILKAHGGSTRESVLVEGYALNCTGASQAMPKLVKGARIACLDMNLQRERLAMSVQVLVTDPEKLAAIRKREEEMAAEHVRMILKSGANVVLTTQGIDDLCLKYFVEAGVLAVRRVLKADLNRIARATGATVLLSLASIDGDGAEPAAAGAPDEAFDAANLGHCDEVEQVRFADDECLVFRGHDLRASSLILRGPNHIMLDEIHRSIHDALCIVKRTIESSSVIVGGGATDVALSVHLDAFANTLATREQLAVKEFAEALLIIPKTLAVNAAQDALDLVAKLRAYHHQYHEARAAAAADAAVDPALVPYSHYGLDLVSGQVRDNYAAGVLEPAMCKVKMIKFATEAAINILRIDEVIKLNPKPTGRPQDDEE